MKCYLLLRNNVETGPFTREELLSHFLKPTDLIWVEGNSTAWKYPAEIEELYLFVTEDTQDETVLAFQQESIGPKSIFVALPSLRPGQDQNDRETKAAVGLDTVLTQSLESGKQSEETQKESAFRFPQTFSKPHSALWLGCVLACLLLSAFLIKKIVDTYADKVNGLATAAAMPVHDMDNVKSLEAEYYQNALTTEVVPVDIVTLKPVKKPAAKVNLKNLVKVDANDYQVGFLGGIKNLRLLVTNKSRFILDKVRIELRYLKPNGDVLKTENLTVKTVGPKSSKSLNVASQNRGVKVAYHITSIQSKQNSENLVHL